MKSAVWSYLVERGFVVSGFFLVPLDPGQSKTSESPSVSVRMLEEIHQAVPNEDRRYRI